jgi:hypothetical protein
MRVDSLGPLVACHVGPAGVSDRKAARALTAGPSALWPRIDTVIADVGYKSRKLARRLQASARCRLKIVKRNQRAFKIAGLNWIVERSFG